MIYLNFHGASDPLEFHKNMCLEDVTFKFSKMLHIQCIFKMLIKYNDKQN